MTITAVKPTLGMQVILDWVGNKPKQLSTSYTIPQYTLRLEFGSSSLTSVMAAVTRLHPVDADRLCEVYVGGARIITPCDMSTTGKLPSSA